MDPTTKNRTENDALIEGLRQAGTTEVIKVPGPGDREVCLIAKTSSNGLGREVIGIKALLDQYEPPLQRRMGTATLTSLESFIALVNRFKDTNSAIFAKVADQSSPRLVAVFDYSEQGPDGKARYHDHKAIYRFPVSEEWAAWSHVSTKSLDQTTFAELLEQRIQDILPPSEAGDRVKGFAMRLGIDLAQPAKLMDVSRGMTVRVDSTVTNAQTLSSGEVKLMYHESHTDEAGQPLIVPTGFALQIPIFRSGAIYQIPVRLRYRRSGPKIQWIPILSHTELIWADAIKNACDAVASATGLPLFQGSPEKGQAPGAQQQDD